MTRSADTHRPSHLGALLREEHARLDATFESLADGFRADARGVGLKEWKLFEAALLAHLNMEEELVLPTFAQLHPHEVQEIRDEHTAIRRDLDELGLGVELHLVSVDLIDRFISKLRSHAAREDALLYEHVDRVLSEEQRGRAIDRVVLAARRLFGARAS